MSTTSGYQGMKMAELLMKYKEEPRKIGKIQCLWFWGKNSEIAAWQSGMGSGFQVYTPINNKWWDGYDGHKTVLFTDEDIITKLNVKKITGPFPFRVETKGGSRQVKYDRVIFASDLHPITLGIDRKILQNRFEIVEAGNEVKGNTNLDFLGDDYIPDEIHLCECKDIDIGYLGSDELAKIIQ